MAEWNREIQDIILQIDRSIKAQDDEALTLTNLAGFLGNL